MNQIIYIFILFNLLFLIERKAINKLLTFVGIIITTALLLAEHLKIIDGTYFSYILILIEVSAFTILFGFIIMLFPTISTRTPSSNLLPLFQPITISYGPFILLILPLIFLLSFYWYPITLYPPFSNLEELYYTNLGELYDESNNFIRKIGLLFFTENCSIFKLILITLILLFAIVALFFFF